MPAYAAVTRSTFRTRIRERLFNTFWSDTELNVYINEALRVWGSLTGFFRQRSSYTFPANTTDHDISTIVTDGFAILRIDLAASHLDPISLDELGQFNATWQQDTAAAPLKWIPLGLNKVVLHPKNTSTAAASVDNLYYAPIPASDGAYIQVGEEDQDALIDYVCFLAAFKEGGEELQAALPLLNNFLQQAAKYNSRLLKGAIFRRILGMPAGGQSNTRPKDREGMSPR